MIGVDTNVLVRYLVQDDPAQTGLAKRFLETELSDRQPGFVSLVVLVETLWVLRSIYALTPVELVETVRDLLEIGQLHVEQRTAVMRALTRIGQRNADLVDALVAEIAVEAGCTRTVTFDRAAMKLGMELLK
jgi:predicted nucleic-acid-binding protein